MNKSAYFSALFLSFSLISCDEKREEKADVKLGHAIDVLDESMMSAKDMYAKAKSLVKSDSEVGADLISEALDWTSKAAEKGYLQAQTDLGALYMYGGKGVEINFEKSSKWFSKAAEQGSVAARCFLGDLLYRGAQGLPQDKIAAMKNWLSAAEQGLPEAQYRVGHELLRVADSAKQGLIWLEKAADAGFAQAALDLGFVHARGVSGARLDMTKAAFWYEKAAMLGNPKALYICALMMESGEAMPQNSTRAMSFLKISAGQNYLPAVSMLVDQLQVQADLGDVQAAIELKAWKKRYEELAQKVKTLKLKP